jgi:hypothetical protein
VSCSLAIPGVFVDKSYRNEPTPHPSNPAQFS